MTNIKKVQMEQLNNFKNSSNLMKSADSNRSVTGTVQISNIEKYNLYNNSKNNYVELGDKLSEKEKKEILESLNADEDLVNKIDNSGDKIKIYFDTLDVYVLDKRDYSIVDILNGYKGEEVSIVSDIDMYSDKADENGLYGGYQGCLINDYEKNLNNKTLLSIISKYYPNEKYTDDDLKLLFSKMNSNGCGYIAGVNVMFELTKNLSDEEFYDKFGYNRYKITRTRNIGSYARNYNYDAMFLDFYLYYQKELGFETIKDIYGNIEIGAEDGAISGDYDNSGSEGTRLYEVAEKSHKFLEEKGINITYDNSFGNDSNLVGLVKTTIEMISPLNDHFNKENIKKALEEGKIVSIAMQNFTVYYPNDIDGNGLLDDIHRTGTGGHGMIVTGMTDDGDLIVSSWGNKYIVKPKYDSIYNRIEDFINGNQDGNCLTRITVYDTNNITIIN